jgi:hypothetical protein
VCHTAERKDWALCAAVLIISTAAMLCMMHSIAAGLLCCRGSILCCAVSGRSCAEPSCVLCVAAQGLCVPGRATVAWMKVSSMLSSKEADRIVT